MMKKIVLAALVGSLAFCGGANALQQSSTPPKFTIPWGNGAAPAYITYPTPTPSQIGITNCRASLTDGFPPLTFVPTTAGGCPPYGADFNGVLKWITLWAQWQGAGATVVYDATLSSDIGGYPKGTVLQNASIASCYWLSTVDNNSSDPDTGGANWVSACPGGGIGGTSTGSATAQSVTVTAFNLQVGSIVTYVSGFTNTGAVTLNVNGLTSSKSIKKWTCSGLAALQGGEIQDNQIASVAWDGTEWQLIQPGSVGAFLNVQNQVLCGGATVQSVNLGTLTTGTTQINCGSGPLQYFTNNGTFTLSAPSSDGACQIMMTNGSSGTVPTMSGFTVGVADGIVYSGNGYIFILSITRINAVSTYFWQPLQ
jgi:hypothetical protein